MSALGKVVRAGVGRRRVQSVVMALTAMTAVAAAIMATALVVASRAPFDHDFRRQHGAHLTAQFDAAKASRAQLAATAHAHGVTAASDPYPNVTVTPQLGDPGPGGGPGGDPLTITGRARARTGLDDLTVTRGHWLTGPGQIVLNADRWQGGPILGSRMSFPGVPGAPTLTVVGLARSVTGTGEAWTEPGVLAALTGKAATPGWTMLYRFADAGSSGRISADRAAVAAAAPAGSLTGAQSWLAARQTAGRQAATFVPFIVAFGVLGLVMSVLIIGIVVSGAVSAGTRRIGILKALGLTPRQVGRAYVGQALIPAAVGIALGVLVGDLASVPLLGQAQGAYRTGRLTAAPWIDIAVPAGMLAVVVVSALAPAMRAARLRTVEAIAVGRVPRLGRGRLAARLAARMPLPRPLTLGLAGPFARPGRSATIAVAILFGVVGVTFAYGLGTSLNRVQAGLNRDQPGDVAVDTRQPPPPPDSEPGSGPVRPPAPADPAAVTRVIAHRPGTAGWFTQSSSSARFQGMSGPAEVVAYGGDSSWGSYQLVSGHWFDAPGQLVVSRRFLQATGTRVGDSVTLVGAGRTARVRIVGEALVTSDDGLRVMTDARTLTAAGLRIRDVTVNVELAHGTDRTAYVKRLNDALRPLGAEAFAQSDEQSPTIIAMDAITAMLTLMLVLVAGLGVLNTVVLDTRERVHDMGVFKALGMAPRQTVAMVVTSVAGIGAVAGLCGVPLGIALHGYIIPVMGHAAGTGIPAADMAVYHAPQLTVLALGGLAIATLGALLPATWAARTRTATALRTE